MDAGGTLRAHACVLLAACAGQLEIALRGPGCESKIGGCDSSIHGCVF